MLSVVDAFVLGPRKQDCCFVRPERVTAGKGAIEAGAQGEGMDVDEV